MIIKTNLLNIKKEDGTFEEMLAIKGNDAKINGKDSIEISAGDNITINDTVDGIKISSTGGSSTYVETEKPGSKIIAHRGLCGDLPENSTLAYEMAGMMGYWGAEADIAETSDGYFVLMHDDSYARTTSGSGNVRTQTFEYSQSIFIDEYPTGQTKMFENENTKLRVPTLEQYLNICAKYNMKAIIEIKNLANSTTSVQKVIDMAKLIVGNNFSIISFDKADLITAREYDNNLHLQLLTSSTPNDVSLSEALQYKWDISTIYSVINTNTGDWVEAANAQGTKIGAWTINDNSQVEALKSWGIDYITSDLIRDEDNQYLPPIEIRGSNFLGKQFQSGAENIYSNNFALNNTSRLMSSSIYNIAGRESLSVGLDYQAEYSATLIQIDPEGRQLPDSGWFTVTEADNQVTLHPACAYVIVYAKRTDNATYQNSDKIALEKLVKMTAFHKNSKIYYIFN